MLFELHKRSKACQYSYGNTKSRVSVEEANSHAYNASWTLLLVQGLSETGAGDWWQAVPDLLPHLSIH